MQKSIALASASLLIFAVYTSLRLSYADFLFRQNTLAAVQHAVQLDPSNARYHAWLGELLDNDGQDQTPALRTATRLNPFDSRSFIRLGLNAESAGHPDVAEPLLLHAAAIDRLMEPRWTLMNFYFRRNDRGRFQTWARQTFAISYGDRTPLFALCWKLKPDPPFVAQLLPDANYPLQFQFFQFLQDKDLTAAAGLALRILPKAAPADIHAYLLCADRLLQSGDPARARQIWNAVRPGPSLSFQNEISQLAFDWRIPATPGVSTIRFTPAAIRFTFSGQQPDACRLLSQTLYLQPFRSYRLSFEYRTPGITSPSGLRVQVFDQTTPDLAADAWTLQTAHFAPAAATGDVALDYRRPPGFIRIEGALELRNFAVEPAP